MGETTETVQWIFTFGFGQTDPKTGRSLSNRYVRVPVRQLPDSQLFEVEAARQLMLERFGRSSPWQDDGPRVANYAFDYPPWEYERSVGRYPQMVEIDFDTGDDLPRRDG